jgi:hypothetical protein
MLNKREKSEQDSMKIILLVMALIAAMIMINGALIAFEKLWM